MENKVYNKKRKNKYKWYNCEECGRPVYKRVRCDRRKLCADCAVSRMKQECSERHLVKILLKNKERGYKNDKSDSRRDC